MAEEDSKEGATRSKTEERTLEAPAGGPVASATSTSGSPSSGEARFPPGTVLADSRESRGGGNDKEGARRPEEGGEGNRPLDAPAR